MSLEAVGEISRVTIDKPKTTILPGGACSLEPGTLRLSENPVVDFWIRVHGNHSVALNARYGTSGIGYPGYIGYEDHVINIVGSQVGIAVIGDLAPVNDGTWHHVVFDLGYATETQPDFAPGGVDEVHLSLFDRRGSLDLFAGGPPQGFPTTLEFRDLVFRPRVPNERYFNDLSFSAVASPFGISNHRNVKYLVGGFLASRKPLKGAVISSDVTVGPAAPESLGDIQGRRDFAFVWSVPAETLSARIKIADGSGKLLAEREIALHPPPKYLSNSTVNIIPTSHNDIAWLDTPGATADWRRDKIIGPAISLLEMYPNYRYGMETNLFLMEYLNRAPAQADKVRSLIAEGRLTFGATYNQPYPSLWSGESLLRQLYFGRKWLRENLGPGVDTVTAWGTDVPSVAMQMPQILAKSGVKFLMLGRFRPGFFDWYSPDGSKVVVGSLGIYWPLRAYLALYEPRVTALQLLGLLQNWDNFYQEHKIPPEFPISDMTDYLPPSKELITLVDRWKPDAEEKLGVPLKLKFATGEEFMKEITGDPGTVFPVVRSEWPNVWAYIHGPTHHDTVSAGREAAWSLVAAEKFWTLRSLASGGVERYPRETFDQAWMAHIYPDHGLGGLNGDITDAVFLAKEEEALLLGRTLLDSSVEWVASHATPLDPQRPKLVVLNPLSWDRSGPAWVEIPTPGDRDAVIMDAAGNSLLAQRVPQEPGGSTRYIVETNGIPANGYTTFAIEFKPRTPDGLSSEEFKSKTFENAFYRLEFAPGGLKSIYDKQLKNEMLDSGEFLAGEVFMLDSPGNGAHEEGDIQHASWKAIEKTSQYSPAWREVEAGPVRTGWRLQTSFRQVTVRVELFAYHITKRLDFDIQILHWSGEKNKEFRMALPINIPDARVAYEVPYGVLEVGKDEIDGVPFPGWYSRPAAEIHPREIQDWISASDGKIGVMLSSSVAVVDYLDAKERKDRRTMLQPILLAARKSVHSLGNWYLQKGDHSYHFAFTSFAGDWKNNHRFGSEVNGPFPSAVVPPQASPPSLPSSSSLCRVSEPNYVVSTIKIADDQKGIIVRGYEIAGRDALVSLSFPFQIERANSTSLIEDDLPAPLGTSNGQLQFRVVHRAINASRVIGRWDSNRSATK